MKIAVLTSSRADYGIYLPLLKALQADPFFDLRLIVFGTHLSSFHGYTKDAIVADGFVIDHEAEHILAADSESAIVTSMGLVTLKFAGIWEKSKAYDLVFCLGDRYEMFAAVAAGVPFGIRFAHLHGGETTLGAIDNVFRHSISLFSQLHFTSTEIYAERVAQITGSRKNIYAVGALSLDSLDNMQLLSDAEFLQAFNIDLGKPTILVTFHPGTIKVSLNEDHARELTQSLLAFTGHQIVITMPNADTMGNALRRIYQEFQAQRPGVFLVENFGTLGYFTCMKGCDILVGNSSSGIIEAASFGKYVVNIGDRQQGRAASDNIIHCEPDKRSISEACAKALKAGNYSGTNIYHKPHVARSIIEILKKTEW